jgi:hypothetical protein
MSARLWKGIRGGNYGGVSALPGCASWAFPPPVARDGFAESNVSDHSPNRDSNTTNHAYQVC